MGWSCNADAARTMDRWVQKCLAQSKSQNVWEANGERYFWERSNVEHDDGAITGSIWRFIGERCRRSGSFRIEGDGTVTTGPRILKECSAVVPNYRKIADHIDGKHRPDYG